jgi:hypothetical protein
LTVSATAESLGAALFGDSPAAHTLLAFVNDEPVAYATYFFTMALDWNESALAFYTSLGAEILSDWRIGRLDEAQPSHVASLLEVR